MALGRPALSAMRALALPEVRPGEPGVRERAVEVLGRLGLGDFGDSVADSIVDMRRIGVISPYAYAACGLDAWFVLVTGRTGHFDQLLAAVARAQDSGVSHHVLFGEWDALLSFRSDDDRARDMLNWLSAAAFDEPLLLRVDETLVAGGLVSGPRDSALELHDQDLASLNALVRDFDDPAVSDDERDRLLESGALLGVTWDPQGVQSAGVTAFMGIQIHGGRTAFRPQELRQELLSRPEIAASLAELHKLDAVAPFQYIARFWCASLDALDIASDSVALARVGGASLKTTTFVVSASRESVPLLNPGGGQDVPSRFKPDAVVSIAQRVFERLPEDARTQMEGLAPGNQLRLMTAMAEPQASWMEMAKARGGWRQSSVPQFWLLQRNSRASLKGRTSLEPLCQLRRQLRTARANGSRCSRDGFSVLIAASCSRS